MEYEVCAETLSGETKESIIVHGPKKATTIARKMAKENENLFVFVRWFRASDGQFGYLNPGENHEPTGKRW